MQRICATRSIKNRDTYMTPAAIDRMNQKLRHQSSSQNSRDHVDASICSATQSTARSTSPASYFVAFACLRYRFASLCSAVALQLFTNLHGTAQIESNSSVRKVRTPLFANSCRGHNLGGTGSSAVPEPELLSSATLSNRCLHL